MSGDTESTSLRPSGTAGALAGGEWPLVSIVTPTYNQARYLRQAIESVLSQDYPRLQYIVLDDGSTDETVQIRPEYAGRLVWERQERMGQARTLNKGWTLSEGAVLSYLAGDDVLLPGAVSAAVRALSEHNEAVMVYPDCSVIDPHSRIIKKSACRPMTYESMVVDQECWVGPGAFFRRSAFEAVGGWRPEFRINPDREFWMRLGLHGSFVMLPRVLAAYRMHPESLTYACTGEAAAEEYVAVARCYFQRPDVPPDILARKAIAFSRAHVVAARIHLRAGRVGRCRESLRTALAYDSHLPRWATARMLARTSISRPIRRVQWSLRHLLHALTRRG